MKLLRFATDYLNDVLGLSRIQIRSDGYEFELSENVDYDGDWDIERIDVDKIKTKKQMLKWIKINLKRIDEPDFKKGFSKKKMIAELNKIKIT